MSNQLFTPAKPKPGQAEIPMGTHHVCRQCGNSYICDQANCSLDFGHECSPDENLPHSQQQANVDAALIGLELRLRKQKEQQSYQRDLFQKEMF